MSAYLPGIGGGVGLLVEQELLVPEPSREEMLGGSELLIVLGSNSGLDLWLNASCVRSMENILAILLVRYYSSSFTNWCPSQSSRSDAICSLGPVPWQGRTGFNIATMPGGIQAIRDERAITIWGDAFRRPLAYRPLCYDSQPTPESPTPRSPAQRPLVLALLQLGIANTTSEEGFRQRARDMLVQAKAGGADIALMPEMYSIGYEALFPGYNKSDSTPLFEWMEKATPLSSSNPSDWLPFFQNTARELSLSIGATFLGRNGDRAPTNSLSLIDRHGKVLFTYSKVHTCNWVASEALTSPGQGFHAANLDTEAGPVRVGGIICYDREQPESARIAATIKGAELILVPNACFWDDSRQRQLQMRARENGAAVMFTNYASCQFANGASTVFDAQGNTLVQGTKTEGVFFAELDLGRS